MADKPIRLHKYMAKAGIASLRKSEDMISNGHVKVNGSIVDTQGILVSDDDVIEVNGQSIEKESFEYYLLHKPTNVISSVGDDRNRMDVVSMISTDAKIFPVGRLDKNTSGLLLLTNDGDFAHHMMHPSFSITKSYEVVVVGKMSSKQLQLLQSGVPLEDESVSDPAIISKNEYKHATNTTTLRLSITQGKNRIIRRMMKGLDKKLLTLHRYQYANLTLDGVTVGSYRVLSLSEVNQLKEKAIK
jgi:23S rRNA pseudouridine2605 synthase